MCAIVLAALAAGLTPSGAGAIVVQVHGPDYSYQPLNGVTPASNRQSRPPNGTHRSGAPAGISSLTYHGGPVMPSNTEYAIFWAPAGFSFPSGYQAAITRYLQDVAADSGKPTNVYSVGTQYTDSTTARAA